MASVNKVILIGNLGADPEVRYTQAGQAVTELRIATSEQWNDKEGQRQERTEWHSVSVWGKTAEHCGQYLAKGRSVYVEGRLESREYTDKDGIKRKVWEVRADKVTFLGGGKDDGQQREATSRAIWQGKPPKAAQPEQPAFEDDPIPF
jgi:single-strand DNA-binding protein